MADSQTSPIKYFAFVRRAGSWLHDKFLRHFFIFFVIMLIILAINELYIFGLKISDWDPLLISGALTFIIGLRLALNVPSKVNETLSRLINRGVIKIDGKELIKFTGKLEAQTEKYAQWCGLIIGVAVLIAFLIAFRLQTQIILTILEVLGGYIAGQFLGRAISYGRLGVLLKNEGIPLQVQPGHIDGAGGFKPVGDLYFFQAMLVAIPAIFLAVWWLIIPLWPEYSIWRDTYVGLLAIILVIEFLAFLLPLWAIHLEMQRQKTDLLKDADGLSYRIVELQSKLIDAQTDQERSELKDRLSLMTERYWAIEQMPTWPVDARVRRKFTFGNLGLFLPLISHFLNIRTDSGKKIWEEFGKIFVSLFE